MHQSYRNEPVDLHIRSFEYFLYDWNIVRSWVKKDFFTDVLPGLFQAFLEQFFSKKFPNSNYIVLKFEQIFADL